MRLSSKFKKIGIYSSAMFQNFCQRTSKNLSKRFLTGVVRNQPAFTVNSSQLQQLDWWPGDDNNYNVLPSHVTKQIPENITFKWEDNNPNPKFVMTIKNVLNHRECQSFINLCNELGFEEALLNIGGGKQIKHSGFRQSQRCMIDSSEITQHLYKRMESFIPQYFEEKTAASKLIKSGMNYFGIKTKNEYQKCVGFNNRMRVLKYENCGYFRPHGDGSYYVNNDPSQDRTLITVLIYLNDQGIDFHGGGLKFLNPELSVY